MLTTDTMAVAPGPAPAVAPGPIHAIVVSYNSGRHAAALGQVLPRCVATPAGGGITVVDNASTDDSAQLFARHLPEATVLKSPANVGYAAAINTAMAHVRATVGVPWAWLILNPDVRLQPTDVAEMAATLARTGWGIAVPRLLDGAGQLIPSLRREPSVRRAWCSAVLGPVKAGRWRQGSELVTDPAAYARETTADWAAGSVLLVTERAAAAVGPWDERYFLYSEETDWMLRARDLRFATGLCPQVTVTHFEGDVQQSPPLCALLHRNRVRLVANRWPSRLRIFGFWLALVVGYTGRAARGSVIARATLRALLGDERVLPPPARRPAQTLARQLGGP